jgi:hypothetical protein
VITERIPRSSDLLAASQRDLGRNLRHKLGRSSRIWMRSSEVAWVVGKVFGPTCRSAGLLAGRVHLTGTFGTLVGGDLCVPMSLKAPIDV